MFKFDSQAHVQRFTCRSTHSFYPVRRQRSCAEIMKVAYAGLGIAFSLSWGLSEAFVPGSGLNSGRIFCTAGGAPSILPGDARPRDRATRISRENASVALSGRAMSRKAGTRGTCTLLDVKRGGASDSSERDTASKNASMSGVGSLGSNVLLILAAALVLKGLFLPEDIRHLSFCPTEDPIRGRDTLPWRMMIDSGRECGTVPEVMFKYITSPVVLPGSPEWGMMLNVKEDIAKEGW